MRTRRNKLRPPWDAEYYVARKDCITMYLWYVRRRGSKQEIAGGWTEKHQAINWLKENWKKQLEKDLEDILLVKDENEK